ncbi:hypothetical protein ANANG_G00006310 [Anguilla anguilla]|uniref:Uncharacterized protein n=1 Tax=Anguilla anguilla TaxID=7936 RepID=A0A9D3MWC7_ANGAN|nr:hypothetical protein ANANG_G00006310 [Anguilla anguilla]
MTRLTGCPVSNVRRVKNIGRFRKCFANELKTWRRRAGWFCSHIRMLKMCAVCSGDAQQPPWFWCEWFAIACAKTCCVLWTHWSAVYVPDDLHGKQWPYNPIYAHRCTTVSVISISAFQCIFHVTVV